MNEIYYFDTSYYAIPNILQYFTKHRQYHFQNNNVGLLVSGMEQISLQHSKIIRL